MVIPTGSDIRPAVSRSSARLARTWYSEMVPFTASHPAAILPFLGGRLGWSGFVPSALVIGSMAPDIPYYLVLPLERHVTHSLTGVVTIDLVLGLLTFVTWHGLVGPATVALAPAGLRERLQADQPAGLRHHLGRPAGWALVVLSLIVGGVTHVVWDAFTHTGEWGPQHIPWLAAEHGPLMGYRYAQYASTTIGGVVIAVFLWRWWRATPPVRDDDQARAAAGDAVSAGVLTAVVVATVGAAVLAAMSPLLSLAEPDYRKAVFLAATRGGAAGMLVLLIFATWWAVAGRHRQRR